MILFPFLKKKETTKTTGDGKMRRDIKNKKVNQRQLIKSQEATRHWSVAGGHVVSRYLRRRFFFIDMMVICELQNGLLIRFVEKVVRFYL